jgi:hypothetical protein
MFGPEVGGGGKNQVNVLGIFQAKIRVIIVGFIIIMHIMRLSFKEKVS